MMVLWLYLKKKKTSPMLEMQIKILIGEMKECLRFSLIYNGWSKKIKKLEKEDQAKKFF